MKLSEAILLGSTVVTPRAGGLRFSRANEGCALGMAAIAVGCTITKALRQIPVKDLRTGNAEDVFGPWLLRIVMRPCECDATLPREMRVKDVIAHLFDLHVMEKQNWTLTQLAEWVERWEPRKSEPGSKVPNSKWPMNLATQPEDLRAQENEWQSTREAFAAKQKSRTRRTPGGR